MSIMDTVKTEPAAVVGAIIATISAFMAFGLQVTVEQLLAVETALLTIGALFVRSQTVTKETVKQAAADSVADGFASGVIHPEDVGVPGPLTEDIISNVK